MEEYFNNLFKEEETWRIQSFIDKMKDFKLQCTTNQQEDFIRKGLFAAQRILAERQGIIRQD